MTVKKKGILLLALILCAGLLLASCAREAEEVPETQAPDMTYTIEITTGSGLAMEDVGVYIYTDATLQELVWFAKTDASGLVTFDDAASDSYVAVLSNVPAGYPVEAQYPLTGAHTRITLGTEMVESNDLANMTFGLGDVMADLTFTTTDGEQLSISQLLQEKKAVVLNFWYLECAPCRAEFPYLQEAYETYFDLIEVVAVNPVNTDEEAIADFKKEQGLTFPVARGEEVLQKAMQLVAYPTTMVIDQFGSIAMIHTGSIPDAEVFERIFAFFSAEDYAQTVVQSVEDLPELEEKPERTVGTKDNPYEFSGLTSFEVTVAPGEEVYMNIYKVKQLYTQIWDRDAYIIYSGKTYKPSGNTVGLTIASESMNTPASLIVGNSGEEEKTFTLYFSQPKGSMGNPYTMELGEFSASVYAGNDQGLFFTYKATEDGVLTMKCTSATQGVDYDFSLYNLSTYAMRNFGSEGQYSEDGCRIVSVKVRAGDRIQFSVGSLPDSSGIYPAASFTFQAYMGEPAQEEEEEQIEKILYAVTVTDADKQPLSGVQLFLTLADGTSQTLTTDETGAAYTKLEPGTYKVTLKVPAGYTARVTEFTLTEAAPVISLKLDKYVVHTAVYTVKAVDEAGAPVPGMLVSVGGSFGYTDENGTIQFILIKGEFTAVIGVPEGYTAENTSIPFGDSIELTVVLKTVTEEDDKDDEEDDGEVKPEGTEYCVSVTDYFGEPLTNATVTFLKDGQPIGIHPVDDNGTVKKTMEPGEYTVALAFDSDSYYYDDSLAVLTEEAPAITLMAAVKQDGTYEEACDYQLYRVSLGATYAQLQTGVVNHFLFTPEQSGLYRFTTTDSQALISYWGANPEFVTDMTSGTDYADNAFTLNIKEGQIDNVSYFLGVTGTQECVILISREGDAILDESDIVPTVYEAKTPPAAFDLQLEAGQSLTYIDITAPTGTYTLVQDADGFYHLNSIDGPMLYVNLGKDAPYVSFYNMMGYGGFGGTSLIKTFYDENGKALSREDYTACMCQYIDCIAESATGLYPLTEDLRYMITQGGSHRGWWDSESPNYLFTEVSGLNPEIAWMFACCYIQ